MFSRILELFVVMALLANVALLTRIVRLTQNGISCASVPDRRHRDEVVHEEATHDTERQPVPAVKPDPTTADSAAEFVQMMAVYRVWAGNRSYRKMAAAIGDRYAPATLSSIPQRTTLPTWDLVNAYLEACDADPSYIETWRTAWRALALAQSQHSSPARPS